MNAWIDNLQAAGAVLEHVGPPEAGIRRVVHFGDPARELAAASRDLVAVPLLDWTAVSIEGPDARAFLQGQFTNDVDALAPGDVQLAGFCSPKGRLLANFPLARIGDSAFRLVVPADIAAAFTRRLAMFVLRSKVVVASLAASHALIGVHRPRGREDGAMRSVFEVADCIIRWPDGRDMLVVDAARARDAWASLRKGATPAGSPVWDSLAIAAGIGVVTAPTQDKFVPQMLNWELLSGVNFRKGCYTGQEIVARMQYLGRLKERLYRAHVGAPSKVGAAADAAAAADTTANLAPGHSAAAPGAPLFGGQFGGQSCGTIVTAAPAAGGGIDVLAVLQIASAEQDAIRLGNADDAPALELLPLPYDVPRLSRETG